MRALLVIALFLLLAPGAEAARWRPIGSTVTGVATDADRYAVWASDRHTVMIAAGTAKPRAVPVGPGCGFVMAIVAGSGRAALLCNGNGVVEARRVVMLDLATGAQQPVPNLVIGAPTLQTVTAVGRRWLQVDGGAGHSIWRYWVDAGTGRKASVRGRRRYPDLDARALSQPLCAPATRPLNPDDDGEDAWPRLGDVQHAGRWLVFRRPAGAASDLMAWRCGRPAPRLLAHCGFYRGACTDVQAGAGLVTWQKHGALHVVRLPRLRRQAARLPRRRLTSVRHTRGRLYRTSASLAKATVYARRLQL